MSQLPPRTPLRVALSLCAIVSLAQVAVGQAPDNALTFDVNGPTQRLEMIVNTSRILEMEFKVPRMLVNNTDIVQATPLSPQEIHPEIRGQTVRFRSLAGWVN